MGKIVVFIVILKCLLKVNVIKYVCLYILIYFSIVFDSMIVLLPNVLGCLNLQTPFNVVPQRQSLPSTQQSRILSLEGYEFLISPWDWN